MGNRSNRSHVHKRLLRRALTCAMASVLMLSAATAEEQYRKPPQVIVDMLEAPLTPRVSIDPTGQMMLLVQPRNMPSIEDLAQPMLRLAGSRINPSTNGNFTTSYNTGLALRRISDNQEFEIVLPPGARLGFPTWSPDGSRFAFLMYKDNGIELWVGHAKTMRARVLAEAQVNAAGRSAYRWMPDSRHILCRLIPRDRGEMPQRSAIPTGPVVEENTGRISPVRTYQDLLTDPHDEAMFDWIMTSRLVMLDCASNERTIIGGPAIYSNFDPSPDGRYLLVSKIQRPYSYRVTARSFPESVEIVDVQGNQVARLADLPLRDTTPLGGVPTGPRSFQWAPYEDTANLLWIEALDEGDPKKEVSHRDSLHLLEAPFDGAAKEIFRTEHRFSGINWIEKSSYALVSEYDRDRRWTRSWRLNVGSEIEQPRVVFDRSSQDRYGDPGRPVMRTNSAGRQVAYLRNGNIFLSGSGASPKGDRPFLDRMNLLTLVTDRMWRSAEKTYESMMTMLPDSDRIITRYETPDDPPNYFMRDLEHDLVRQLTFFEDPTPELRGIQKQLVTYMRDDGVPLSATLYLPAGYEPGEPLPLIVWAYPREFNSARTAGQVRGSPYRFTRIRGTSHLFFLTQGYAIMDGATMPVIGDPETMNDTFLDQIVASARAAIDTAAEMGVGDPRRVGVGGHSYGAFMTGNLLAHCDLFNAGIARSVAYNRTLTPFGFQSERRTLWEAPMSYFRISPFMHADKINEPILLIHGEKDNNSGTFPIQSQRFFHALKGHGATVRLVMLPHESHGYRAKESVMHVLAEMIDWFDTHVKRSGSGYDDIDRDTGTR